MSRSKIIGWGLFDKLAKAGIIPPENVMRVVIDIACDNIVIVYVEMAGDERMLEVFGPVPGIEIIEIEEE